MNRNREPYNKVKAFLIERDINHKDIAELLNIKPNTITKRLNGFGGDFSLNEVATLNQKIGIPYTLFFEPRVPKKEQKEPKQMS